MKLAPGGPGTGPRWGPGAKQGFGAAADRRVHTWFTVARGNLSEVFFPRLDQPCLHELRFIAAAPGAPPVDDATEAVHEARWVDPGVPWFEVQSTHAEYRLTKQFIPDPDRNAVLIAGNLVADMPDVTLYLQASAHLRPGAEANDGFVLERDPPALALRQGESWMAVVGPFSRGWAGYRETSDLFVELHDTDSEPEADWDSATAGNATVGAHLAIRGGRFQVAVGFGTTLGDAEDAAREALARGAGAAIEKLTADWRRHTQIEPGLARVSGDGGALARASLAVLQCLEDRSHPGAFVAAPAAAWGESVTDGNQVYHLVWPRDLCAQATALLDAGDRAPAQRALAFLAETQRDDGGWDQNFDLDGRPHWSTDELDEVATPVLLAWRLGVAGALESDPWPRIVRRAARWLVTHGPATPYDRWEDAGGLSPSALATGVAALVVSAELAADAGELDAARYLLMIADGWQERIDAGTYLKAFRHYVRLNPSEGAPPPRESAAGVEFVELVRRGLRQPEDARIVHSVATADALLKASVPGGPAWRRYVGDAYGETVAGDPWPNPGTRGRPWPLLTAERAQLEAMMGRPVGELVTALEAFAGPELLIPEQVWDDEPIPARGLEAGQPTGSVRPLGWAHAEYLRLLVALSSGRQPDVVEPLVRRYGFGSPDLSPPVVWHPRSRLETLALGRRLVLQYEAPGAVVWTADEWGTRAEVELRGAGLDLWVAELDVAGVGPGAVVEWIARLDGAWEGGNHRLAVVFPTVP